MDLPAHFVRNIEVSYGAAGVAWLRRLPTLVEEAARRWSIAPGEPFPLSYNYAARCTLADGTEAVLKVGPPGAELASEMRALRAYAAAPAGELRCCRPLALDEGAGMMLLERFTPGAGLDGIMDEGEAARIYARALRACRLPAPAEDGGYQSLADWLARAFADYRAAWGRGGPIAEGLIGRAEALAAELLSEGGRALVHGDLHHYNIVSRGEGWGIIDPKGLVAPPEYEAAPYMINPWGAPPDATRARARTELRLEVVGAEGGLDRARVLAWCYCHAVLSACWDLDDAGAGGESALGWAEAFRPMLG